MARDSLARLRHAAKNSRRSSFRATILLLFAGGLFAASSSLRADSSSELSPSGDSDSVATKTGLTDYALHFKGVIDGDNCITLEKDRATWQQTSTFFPNAPRSISINDLQWNWKSRARLIPDKGSLLPEVDFSSARIEVLQGGDIVACERYANRLVIYVDDTSERPAPYEFIAHFSTVIPKETPRSPSESVHLKISATIDGSDRLIITHDGARWEHKAWSPASNVTLNKVEWALNKSSELKNDGPTQFLPKDVDFSTAQIVSRQGRDLVTAEAKDDELIVSFADNPVGSDDYEIEIAFGGNP